MKVQRDINEISNIKSCLTSAGLTDILYTRKEERNNTR